MPRTLSMDKTVINTSNSWNEKSLLITCHLQSASTKGPVQVPEEQIMEGNIFESNCWDGKKRAVSLHVEENSCSLAEGPQESWEHCCKEKLGSAQRGGVKGDMQCRVCTGQGQIQHPPERCLKDTWKMLLPGWCHQQRKEMAPHSKTEESPSSPKPEKSKS